jgi:hypothetical protein
MVQSYLKTEEAPVALFITYTMLNPIVGGAFFRALRLACELERRGWSPIICNYGPTLDDPKIDRAMGKVRFESLSSDEPGFDSETACRQFTSFNPKIVIMGEGPIPAMEVFYYGAMMVPCPFLVLDQYYNSWLLPMKEGVDLALLYGLRSFWEDELQLAPPYVMVPPFIEAVTAPEELPIPTDLRSLPWMTLIAYDSNVLKGGIDLMASLGQVHAAVITVSRDTREAMGYLSEAGIDMQRVLALPLQSDANVFGLMGASRVTLVSNGFLQIMEALAMGSPVIALKRGSGVGMGGLNIDTRFVPYVSFQEDQDQQKERIMRWLEVSPFPPDLYEKLKSERRGTSICADYAEALALHWKSS